VTSEMDCRKLLLRGTNGGGGEERERGGRGGGGEVAVGRRKRETRTRREMKLMMNTTSTRRFSPTESLGCLLRGRAMRYKSASFRLSRLSAPAEAKPDAVGPAGVESATSHRRVRAEILAT